MDPVVTNIIQGSALGTLVFALFIALKRPAQKRCGAKAWHSFMILTTALFIVPMYALKMALSFIFLPIHRWIRIYFTLFTKYQSNTDTVKLLPNNKPNSTLLWVWLIGLIAYLVIRCALYAYSTSRLRRGLKDAPANVLEVFANSIISDKKLNLFGRLRHVDLYIHDKLMSPIAYGFCIKKIVLPGKIIENYTTEDICLILRHESVHIIHHDSWKRLFLAIARAINWFNPILFLLEKQLNIALEIYCDQETLEDRFDRDARQQYSELLITMIDKRRRFAMAGSSMADKNFINKRLAFLTHPPKRPDQFYIALLSTLLCVTVFLCLLIFTASASYAQNNIPSGYVDYGEPAQSVQRLPPDNSVYTVNLSEQGEQVFEQQLYTDIVNYIPVAFSTTSSSIYLKLLEGDCSVLVYIYYSSDKSYPLMQMRLEQQSEPKAFSGLFADETYMFGLLIDQNTDNPTKLLVSDHD